jgi:hypothetical protein
MAAMMSSVWIGLYVLGPSTWTGIAMPASIMST